MEIMGKLVGWLAGEGRGIDVRGLVGLVYLAAVSLPLCVLDLRERRLPNAIVLPGYAFAALGVGWPALARGDPPETVVEAIACCVVIPTVLLAAASGGGLGMGDVKLAGLLALVLGGLALEGEVSAAPAVGVWLSISFVAAGTAGLVRGVRAVRGVRGLSGVRGVRGLSGVRRVRRSGVEALADELPLGPFLLAGFWVVLTGFGVVGGRVVGLS